jgi:hypothetical protein
MTRLRRACVAVSPSAATVCFASCALLVMVREPDKQPTLANRVFKFNIHPRLA